MTFLLSAHPELVEGRERDGLSACMVRQAHHERTNSFFILHGAAGKRHGGLLINLIRNSIQAHASKLNISSKINNNSIELYLTDNGTGIPEGFRDKIFESNFTTKEKGMGLGLKLAKRFIESINGQINLVSSSDPGTTFKISIPLIKHDVVNS